MADHIYAVARIRSLETSLLTKSDAERLIAIDSYDELVRHLKETLKWGSQETVTGDQILDYEITKMWKDIADMTGGLEAFRILVLPSEYHNLKACVKQAVTEDVPANIFYKDKEFSDKRYIDAVRMGEWDVFPEDVREAVKDAFESLAHAGNGQLADAIIDKACLEKINKLAESEKEQVLKDYADLFVFASDIRCAVRSAKTAKSLNFLDRSIAPCNKIDTARLKKTASISLEELLSFLEQTGYKELADAVREGNTSFEKWFDDQIMELIKPQKYNSFTIGAVAAYILARMNEIRMVRIILAVKRNGMDEKVIRERMRELYV